MDESTKLVYDVGEDDVQAMRLHFLHTSPFYSRRRRRMQFILAVIGIVYVFMGYRILSAPNPNVTSLVVGIVAFAFGIMAFIYVPVVYRRLVLRALRGQNRAHPVIRALGRRSLWIEGGWLHSETSDAKSQLKIMGLPGAYDTPTHVFIYLDGSTGYVIPKTKLVSGDVTAFLKEYGRIRAGGAR